MPVLTRNTLRSTDTTSTSIRRFGDLPLAGPCPISIGHAGTSKPPSGRRPETLVAKKPSGLPYVVACVKFLRSADVSERRRVLVGFDEASAASPTQLYRAAAESIEIGFMIRNLLSSRVRRLLGAFGPVIEVSNMDALRAWRPDGITTFSEALLLATARTAALLDLPFTGEHTLRKILDKAQQRTTLANAGVEVVRFARLTRLGDLRHALEYVGVPAVLKPARGSGSRDTYLLVDLEHEMIMAGDLDQSRNVGTAWIVEELLEGLPRGEFGDYVSLEAVVEGGRVVPLAITGKFPLAPPFRETGGIFPPAMTHHEKEVVTKLGVAAIEALDIATGMVHVEMKLTMNGPRIIEVNPRLGGYSENLIVNASSNSFVDIALRCAVQEPIDTRLSPHDQIAWFYAPQAPKEAIGVKSISGFREARAVSGATSAHQRAREGMDLDWRRGWGDYLAFFEGRCASHEAVIAAKHSIDAALQVDFYFA
jgi:hypothetical protein